MTRLVQATFRIFLCVWKQGNTILHDAISGAKRTEALEALHRICRYPYYVRCVLVLHVFSLLERVHACTVGLRCTCRQDISTVSLELRRPSRVSDGTGTRIFGARHGEVNKYMYMYMYM